MAAKVILALFLSLFFISQVSSDLKSNEETNHVSQALHVINRGGYRKVMHNIDIGSNIGAVFGVAPAPSPTVKAVECDGLCKKRCSLHSRQNLCLRACGTCCERCHCVPPGTYGNREACGKCYTDMTTHHNKTKCP